MTEERKSNIIAIVAVIVAVAGLGTAGVGAWSDVQSDYSALEVRVQSLEQANVDGGGKMDALAVDIGRVALGMAKIETLVSLLVARDGLRSPEDHNGSH